jgi:hypothetical protein
VYCQQFIFSKNNKPSIQRERAHSLQNIHIFKQLYPHECGITLLLASGVEIARVWANRNPSTGSPPLDKPERMGRILCEEILWLATEFS